MITWTKELKEKAAAYYGVHGKAGIAEHLGLDITDSQVRHRLGTMKVLPKTGKVAYPPNRSISEELREKLRAMRKDKEIDRRVREGGQKFWNSERGAAHKKASAERLRIWRETRSEEAKELWLERKIAAHLKFWNSGNKKAEEVRERMREQAKKRWAQKSERDRQSELLREYRKTGLKKADRQKKEREKDENNTAGTHP